MMVLWYGNVFYITGRLDGYTLLIYGLIKKMASNTELWCFFAVSLISFDAVSLISFDAVSLISFDLKEKYQCHTCRRYNCTYTHESVPKAIVNKRGAGCAVWHMNVLRYTHYILGDKGQWVWALMLYLICAWINRWVNNREAGDFRCHRTHYNVIVMIFCWSVELVWNS